MAERKPLKLLPIGLTMAAMAVLTVGSFFGCANGFMEPPSRFVQLCFYGFFVFGAGFVISAIWLLVAIVLKYSRGKDDGL